MPNVMVERHDYRFVFCSVCREPQVSQVLVIFSSDLPTVRFGTDLFGHAFL